MAAGGTGLARTDHVTDKLLSHVSDHVIPKMRKKFAIELRVNYDHIHDDEQYSINRSFEVLREWRNKADPTVNAFVKNIHTWQSSGYLNCDVWQTLQDSVNPDLLPAEVLSSAPSVDSNDDLAPMRKRSVNELGSNAGLSVDSGRKSNIKPLPQEDLKEIQDNLKKSLRNRCESFMSNDWLPEDAEGNIKIPVEGFYMEPDWTRTEKAGLQEKQVSMRKLYDIFDIYKDNSRIIAEGDAGSGKSSAVAKLAMDWVQSKETADESKSSQTQTGLRQFDFTFLIKLKNVEENISLEREIINQHDLEAKEDQIKSIFKHSKTLVIFDGYDEYKKGTNSAIDTEISGKRGNSFVLVTSRPDYMDKKDKDKLDGKIQLRGLSKENIRLYIERYLDGENAKSLMKAAKRSKTDELLRIPIIALMLCILYGERKRLPRTQTEIIREIIQIYITRAKEKGVELPNEDEMMYILGELSWEALQRKTRQLLIKKSDVVQRCALLLNLGLLQGDMSRRKASLHKQPTWLTLPHKLFQDFLGGYFLSKMEEVKFQSTFHSLYDISKHRDQIKFALALTDDKFMMFDLVCELWLHPHHFPSMWDFKSFAEELDIDPLCNNFFYFVRRLPLKIVSRWYILDIDRETDTNDDNKSDPDGDSESDKDGDSESDPDGDSELDNDGDTKWDTDGDSESDTDGDSESDTDGDCESDTDGDSESDTDGDSESDPHVPHLGNTAASSTCGVLIKHLGSEEILTAISNLKQTIRYLHSRFEIRMKDVNLNGSVRLLNPSGLWVSIEDVDINVPVFKMDPDARYVHIKSSLPTNVQIDLGQQLSSCDKLQHLHIPKMTYAAPLIVNLLGTKTNITHLNFENCHLSEDLSIVLCQQLRFLNCLKYLNLNSIGLHWLRQNHIGSEGAEYLAESIMLWGPNSPLKKLKLSSCSIEGSGAVKLMAALKNCRHLETLRLDENPIGSEGAEHLAECVTSWGPDPPLKELLLLSCSIEGSGAEKLVESFQFCRRLEEIYMNHNNIGSTGAKKLAASIKSWSSENALMFLSLAGCSIDAFGCISLMEALASCKQLCYLYVSYNHTSGTFKALNPHLVYPRLSRLFAADTSLTEGDIQNISAMIYNKSFPHLEDLFLGYDKLTGELLPGLEGWGGKYETGKDGRFTEMFKSESDEMLEAWGTIVQKVRVVRLQEGEVNIKVTKKIIKQEKERRKVHLNL